MSTRLIPAMLLALGTSGAFAQERPTPDRIDRGPVVCHIKVLSDKVPDLTSLETWKAAYIKEGMSDEQKAMAVWKTVRSFQHQEAPPNEFLQSEEAVQDAVKLFNVYGYSLCSVASCEVECLARYAGLQARGRILNGHSVPEVFYDGAWHLLDSSLMCYFPKADGKAASVDEIMAGIKAWYDEHPDYRKNNQKLMDFMRQGGWRKGPEVLSRCPSYDENGWFEAATHGWYSTMQEYDGSATGLYEYGYSQGYQVNLQLRPGERLTRNWSNKGLHVNMRGGGGEPGCMKMQTGKDSLRYTPKDGDLAPGRLGNGTTEYQVPAALLMGAAQGAGLTLRMPSSYVYLSGKVSFKATGPVSLSFSDNHGLDWKEIPVSGSEVDLTPYCFCRYDYRLWVKGTVQSLRIVHDIQNSQRTLPALGAGQNTLRFSAGPAEGTLTLEGSTNPGQKGKQLAFTDFHPTVTGMENGLWVGGSGKGEVTFPVTAPGEIVRLRFGSCYRARDGRDGIDYLVSFDAGKTWKTAGRAAGPTAGNCTYVVFSDVPAGTREAWVRYAGTSRNATGLLNFRIDADYKEPQGGFRPVKITYLWEENGKPREDVHIARKPEETWTLSCGAAPVMKSIVLELAD